MPTNFFSSCTSANIKSMTMPVFLCNSSGVNAIDDVNLYSGNSMAQFKNSAQLAVLILPDGTDYITGYQVFPVGFNFLSSVRLTEPLSSSGTTLDGVEWLSHPQSSVRLVIPVGATTGDTVDGINLINHNNVLTSAIKLHIINSSGLSIESL